MVGFDAGSRVPRSLVAGLVALMLAGCASARPAPTVTAAQGASTWHEDALAVAAGAGADSQARAYLNFDVFGYCDTIWAMVPEDDAVFGAAMKQAGTAGGVERGRPRRAGGGRWLATLGPDARPMRS